MNVKVLPRPQHSHTTNNPGATSRMETGTVGSDVQTWVQEDKSGSRSQCPPDIAQSESTGKHQCTHAIHITEKRHPSTEVVLRGRPIGVWRGDPFATGLGANVLARGIVVAETSNMRSFNIGR
ncbi:hypothetical protein CERSUDRAFT_71407 [Gelatoporia subvermispora B]|uniref:Uncharacterized protein n=1 Tax=Ceriporiopsis subvermispora (strain B) TaxID=914234 RepID=M2RL15_CERS8|nr:hypothetical protein CERSUDRAFT_71407 [Gelatoporia subvermispora B]